MKDCKMKYHRPWSASFIDSVRSAIEVKSRRQVAHYVFGALERQIRPEGFNNVPYTQDPLFCELKGVNEDEI